MCAGPTDMSARVCVCVCACVCVCVCVNSTGLCVSGLYRYECVSELYRYVCVDSTGMSM